MAAGLRASAEVRLSWDLRVPYWHLSRPPTWRGSSARPIVLNHTGFPWDRSEEGLAAWRRGMEAVARQPNVHVKVSEFGLKDSAWDYKFNDVSSWRRSRSSASSAACSRATFPLPA